MAKNRASQAAGQLREEKRLVTLEMKKNRHLIGLIKEKHSEILDIEDKVHFVSTEI